MEDKPQNTNIDCGEVVRLGMFSFEFVFTFPFFFVTNLKYIIKNNIFLYVWLFKSVSKLFL